MRNILLGGFRGGSLEIVCEIFFLRGRGGEGQDSGLSSGSSWLFYMFSLGFRNISFSEELSWLFCHCGVFCDILSVGC